MMVFTLIASAAMLVMLLVTLYDGSLAKNRPIYSISAGLCLALFLFIYGPAGKRPQLVYPTIYTFVGILFVFGILLGTFIEPNEATVSFMILLFAVPLLFTDRPLRMDLAIAAGMVVYLILAAYTQTPTYFSYNLTNVLPYGILSIVVSTFMMHIKIERVVLAHENRFLSEYDQLTRLKNRRSFEQHLARLQERLPLENALLCAMDVNELKSVNDRLGHSAGDELIKGAADCIEAVFGSYGSCYRTGGDEFAAILEDSPLSPEELSAALAAQTRKWTGQSVSYLTISLGIVSIDPALPLNESVIRADREMYLSKAAFYAASGHDRRRR